ncbi:hypothetical protein B0H67DRAFT_351484 [Lasiosphaeris hirsuta]|uniref:Uncharacterized protein n=1 Tax=Lasiosphaeris hirsuta TaxID=260670 RepID=A0AA39ZVM4_9PEZI|nr:hypothetical protein B0H67DRAFT_351484 [Lasiosphaeris hirsuta]
MRSWVKNKLVRRHGDSATHNTSDAGLIRVDETKELQQVVAPQLPIHSPSTRDASSSLGVWCWRCRAVDPRHWFRVSTPQIEPLDWTADKCNEICEVRNMVQKLVTRPVTFNVWIWATHNEDNRRKWIKMQPCFQPNYIVYEDQLWLRFYLREGRTLTLLDHLDESVATVEAKTVTTRSGYDPIKVNLKLLREHHALGWMKTVTITPHDHGGWRSVSLTYATTQVTNPEFSEPVYPGRVSTASQRILVPAPD